MVPVICGQTQIKAANRASDYQPSLQVNTTPPPPLSDIYLPLKELSEMQKFVFRQRARRRVHLRDQTLPGNTGCSATRWLS